MSDVIKILPSDVACQIAAGEVVNRPSSVVKELVENSIDAGADNIQVLLVDAGRTSIQVIDNGCGMSKDDARLCFERHATSKISKSDDLYSISTFGFRGEALASIAAVSEVELRTRRKEDEVGVSISISASAMESEEPVVCSVGCNFIVKNLFFNVPARRKFLKNNQTEFARCQEEIERVSLAHPEISISLFHQGQEIITLTSSNIKQRIIALFGKKMNQTLMPVEVHTTMIDISGFCGTLDGTRKHGSEQFFFVNNRFMKHPYFHKAVVSAYEKLLPEGEQPSYFLFFKVPQNCIDVNVHPTKTEIKFSEEAILWKIIASAVSEAVGKNESMPTIDFNTEDMPDIPIFDGNKNISKPQVNYNPNYNPFNNNGFSNKNNDSQWTKLIGDAIERKINDSESASQRYTPLNNGILEPEEKRYKCFQFQERFIIASSDSGVMIIDQHRAHIRILFERYLEQLVEHNVVSQGLLFPEMFQLSMVDATTFKLLKDDFQALGFDISDMGHGAIAVQSVPAGLENRDYEKLVVEMIRATNEEGVNSRESQREKMALSMATTASMTSGKSLGDEEMNEIIRQLMACKLPSRTPDGKVVYLVQTSETIKKMFD